MKLLYEIVVIDLPRDQWRPHHPWPVRLALAIVAFLAGLLAAADRAVCALRVVVTAGRAALGVVLADLARAAGRPARVEPARCGLRIAAAAGRVTLTVIWADLAFGLGQAIVGHRLQGALCPA